LGEKVWIVPKKEVEIEFEIDHKKILIKGKELIGRPEMRLKKRWKR
jgi:ribonuclease P protein subunit POP4